MLSDLKTPPVLDEETLYENYKKEVEIWKILVGDDLQKKQLGPALFKMIKLRNAKEKILELEVNQIGGNKGVKLILEKLDQLYLKDKNQRIFLAVDDFETFKRDSGTDMNKFLSEFEQKHNKIRQFDCVLPDGFLAYKLMKAANLTESQEQLCKATIRDWTFDDMILVLKRIFDNVSSKEKNTAIKIEAVNLTENVGLDIYNPYSQYEEDNISTNNKSYCEGFEEQTPNMEQQDYYVHKNRTYNPRGSNSWSNSQRFPYRGNMNYSNPYTPRKSMLYRPSNTVNSQQIPVSRSLNRRDSRGNLTKCIHCRSIMHWIQDCPHISRDVTTVPSEAKLSHKIETTLFQSTSVRLEEMECFAAETVNLAIIDCGCTCTVSGKNTYERYIQTLTETQRRHLKEESSDVHFRFGDNPIIQSHKKVHLPVNIGGTDCSLMTEIVDQEIPLLLSKSSMKKAGAQMNFENDTITLFGNEQPMIITSSGHYAISINNNNTLPVMQQRNKKCEQKDNDIHNKPRMKEVETNNIRNVHFVSSQKTANVSEIHKLNNCNDSHSIQNTNIGLNYRTDECPNYNGKISSSVTRGNNSKLSQSSEGKTPYSVKIDCKRNLTSSKAGQERKFVSLKSNSTINFHSTMSGHEKESTSLTAHYENKFNKKLKIDEVKKESSFKSPSKLNSNSPITDKMYYSSLIWKPGNTIRSSI